MPNCRSVRPRSRLMGSTIRPMMKRSSTENQYSSASTTVAYQPTAGRGYGVTPGGVAVMVPLIQTPPIRDCRVRACRIDSGGGRQPAAFALVVLHRLRPAGYDRDPRKHDQMQRSEGHTSEL